MKTKNYVSVLPVFFVFLSFHFAVRLGNYFGSIFQTVEAKIAKLFIISENVYSLVSRILISFLLFLI